MRFPKHLSTAQINACLFTETTFKIETSVQSFTYGIHCLTEFHFVGGIIILYMFSKKIKRKCLNKFYSFCSGTLMKSQPKNPTQIFIYARPIKKL